MAGSPEQQRRFRVAERRVLRRFRVEEPDKFRHWLEEAKAEIAAETEAEETMADG